MHKTAKGDEIDSNLHQDSGEGAKGVDEALHPMTASKDDGKHGDPPAQDSEGKTHQHAVDPTDGKDIEIMIDGKQHRIVSIFCSPPFFFLSLASFS